MGKQGSITSFFRPANSSKKPNKSESSAIKSTSSGLKKRPRPQTPTSASVEPAKSSPEKVNAKSEKNVKRMKAETSLPEEVDDNSKHENPKEISIPETAAQESNLVNEVKCENSKDKDGSDSAEETETPDTPPSKPSSLPIDSSILSEKCSWKAGKPVPYEFLATTFSKVEQLTGRLEIQAILSEVFRAIIKFTPDDLVSSIYLCINKLAPAHEGVELGIGESILLKCLSQVTGRTVAALKATYNEIGDLGDVASAARTTQKTMFPPPPLTVRKVYSEFRAIASISGKSTQDAKRAKIVKMLVAASKTEAKYIARALQGKLRIHLADKTVIAALAAAMTLENLGVSTDFLLAEDGKKKTKMSKADEDVEEKIKEAASILGAVYSQLPVWDVIIPKLLEFGTIDERLTESCKLMPGIPVSPMLAKPTKAISEVLERFAETSFTCEYKYDGERAQVHRLADGSMKIYSRNAENLTPKYPDLVEKLPEALSKDFKKASFIIDAEAVAFDTEKKQILPFQELQGRKRKDVDANNVSVKVCIFAFDLLFFDGVSLIEEPLSLRREKLQSGFMEKEGEFMFAKCQDSKDPEEIMELLNRSIKEGCEGLMVKALEGQNSTYEPANRSQNWLKVKKDYLDGCGDSLDLVPIGGYLGRGKRTGTYGAFLLACYDPDSEEYQSICKIGTGFSEAVLESISKFYNDSEEERTSKSAKSYYRTPALKTLEPDVWFEPVQVWEVLCADLSISPQHTAAAGLVDAEKGIALRFPRFVRERDDKKPDEATTAEQVAEFYLRQSSVANNN